MPPPAGIWNNPLVLCLLLPLMVILFPKMRDKLPFFLCFMAVTRGTSTDVQTEKRF